MASRSTRNKIIFQGKKIKTSFRKLYEHSQYLDELANGESETINSQLPALVKLTKITEEYWDDFLSAL